MTDAKGQRLYRLLDRAFWLIWLAFPVMIWLAVADIRGAPAQLAALYPDQAACIAKLPQVDRFTSLGQVIYWSYFAFQFALYAILLALAHQVIHRCAVGRVLAREMIGSLRAIGLIIAGWPILDLILSNGMMFALARTGDLPDFVPNSVPDLTVIGVGLLLLTIASAMRQAVELREEADLTI